MSIALLYDRKSRAGQKAFTRIDLLIVIITLVVAMGAVSFPLPTGSKVRAQRISCVNNFRQIGIASHRWADDHDSNFVWQVSTTDGGALESARSGNILASFLAMTNELVSPKILTCPSDKARQRTGSFTALSQRNISYFIALDCPSDSPQAILAGDRNVKADNSTTKGCLTIRSNSVVGWTKEIHSYAGNLALADGSSQQVNPQGLSRQIRAQFALSTNQTMTWLLP
jgi:hypothetical protein